MRYWVPKFNGNLRPLAGSMVLAILLWLAVKLSVVYEYQFPIQITAENIKPGKILGTELPDHAMIRVTGNGRALLALRLLWRE